MPCCHPATVRPSAAAYLPISPVASANRAGETHRPSQPSPCLATRRRAASDRPPITIGTGGSGAGEMRTWSMRKKVPSMVTSVPASSGRSTASASSIRRPRVVGSTPQARSSAGSSPPTPTPKTSRPGASAASEAT